MEKIKLKSVQNIRDFGGTENDFGEIIKPGMFIRSAALSGLTPAEMKILRKQYNLKTIIDLRTPAEVSEAPDPQQKSVDYYNISLLNKSVFGISHERETDRNPHMPEMGRLYKNIVTREYAVNSLKQVFQTIIQASENGAVLWHCSEGKDRCGIVSALFLSLLDVDLDIIYDDYLETNRSAKKKASKFYWGTLLRTGDLDAAKAAQKAFLADEQYLQAAFDAIDAKYGGVDAFLKDVLGITDEMRKSLRKRCLE